MRQVKLLKLLTLSLGVSSVSSVFFSMRQVKLTFRIVLLLYIKYNDNISTVYEEGQGPMRLAFCLRLARLLGLSSFSSRSRMRKRSWLACLEWPRKRFLLARVEFSAAVPCPATFSSRFALGGAFPALKRMRQAIWEAFKECPVRS